MRRKTRRDIAGLALIACTLAGFAGFGAAAVRIDAENGLTVSQSLCTAGIGCSQAERSELLASRKAERPAVPVRLIGRCGGRMLAAMEESAFPAGCEWIAPIAEEEER